MKLRLVADTVSYNLAGTVKSMSLPVKGTTLLLYDYWQTKGKLTKHCIATQVTDAKGEFSFAVKEGNYTLDIIPNLDSRFACQSLQNISIITNTTLSLNLHPGLVVSGIVSNDSGIPLKNCQVLVFGIDSTLSGIAASLEPGGSYSISVPKGRYVIVCRYNTPVLIEHYGEPALLPYLAPYLQMIDVQDDTTHHIQLPAFAQFTGTVIDQSGLPAAAVKVEVSCAKLPMDSFFFEVDFSVTCVSDQRGTFALDVQPGIYNMAFKPPLDRHLSEKRVYEVLIDESRSETFVLPTGYHLSGQVSYQGELLQGCTVIISNETINLEVLTDVQGNFSFSVEAGCYYICVLIQVDSMNKELTRLLAPWVGYLVLDKDVIYNIEMEQGTLVAGKILNANKLPRPDVKLHLYQDNDKRTEQSENLGLLVLSTVTSPDGSYEFSLNPGKYWLVFNNQIANAYFLEITGDGIISDIVNDEAWKDMCMLTLEVVSEEDKPIAYCQVSSEPYAMASIPKNNKATKTARISALTSIRGVCQLVLPIGIYSLYFDPPRTSCLQPKQIRQLSLNGDMNRRITLFS